MVILKGNRQIFERVGSCPEKISWLGPSVEEKRLKERINVVLILEETWIK